MVGKCHFVLYRHLYTIGTAGTQEATEEQHRHKGKVHPFRIRSFHQVHARPVLDLQHGTHRETAGVFIPFNCYISLLHTLCRLYGFLLHGSGAAELC